MFYNHKAPSLFLPYGFHHILKANQLGYQLSMKFFFLVMCFLLSILYLYYTSKNYMQNLGLNLFAQMYITCNTATAPYPRGRIWDKEKSESIKTRHLLTYFQISLRHYRQSITFLSYVL